MEQNGIIFNNVKTAGIEKEAWPLILAGQQGPDEDGGVINAVDIDWNAATPGIGETSDGINTTGELLSRIKEVYSPVFANWNQFAKFGEAKNAEGFGSLINLLLKR